MPITIRYFASLKEKMGHAEHTINYTRPISVEDIWNVSNPALQRPDNILAAVNMEYVRFDFIVKDNDEVAFFPPVTGG